MDLAPDTASDINQSGLLMGTFYQKDETVQTDRQGGECYWNTMLCGSHIPTNLVSKSHITPCFAVTSQGCFSNN